MGHFAFSMSTVLLFFFFLVHNLVCHAFNFGVATIFQAILEGTVRKLQIEKDSHIQKEVIVCT